MGDVRTQRREPDCEKAILDALERPLSRRELWSIVGRSAMMDRVLRGLLKSGAVAEAGTRRTFDFGTERTLHRVKAATITGKKRARETIV
jgi:hypothetical protein